MTFELLLHHRVRLRRKTVETKDRYNNVTLSAPPGDPDPVPSLVQPNETVENLRDRDSRRMDYVVFLEADTELTGLDTIEWLDEDLTLQVEGDPVRTDDGVGEHHLEVQAFRTIG